MCNASDTLLSKLKLYMKLYNQYVYMCLHIKYRKD